MWVPTILIEKQSDLRLVKRTVAFVLADTPRKVLKMAGLDLDGIDKIRAMYQYSGMEKAALLKTVLRKTRLLRKIAEAQNKLEAGTSIASIINYIPCRTVDLFSIFKTPTKLGEYLLEISKMKIEHVEFGHAQNFSDKTIMELSQALKNYIIVNQGCMELKRTDP